MTVVGDEVGSGGDDAVLPHHDALDVDPEGHVGWGLWIAGGGSGVWIDVLLAEEPIDRTERVAVAHDLRSSPGREHVVAIAQVRNNR